MLLNTGELTQFLENLKQRLETSAGLDWSIPEPPPEPPGLHANRLEWRPSEFREQQVPITVEELRSALPVVMMEYVVNPDGKILLVKAAAGGGKTHGGVTVVQELAREGYRILWAASRHSLWDDIARLPHFDPALWYHWLPIHTQQGELDLIPTTCRYSGAQNKWNRLGYSSHKLCEQLCTMDGYINDCLYRRQRTRKEPIIFGMHQHLASGLAIDDFDIVIVDELPLGAFVEKRTIPPTGILVPGASGVIKELFEMLYLLTGDPKETFSGKELFERIGPILKDVYAQVEFLGEALPQVPMVAHPDEVDEKPYWFIKDLLDIAVSEFQAWKAGWPAWVERLRVNRYGLCLHKRAQPWIHLPERIIVLDATATPGMYRQIFNRDLRVFNPHIKRKGKLYQIVGRLNGTTSLVKDEEPTKHIRELLTITQKIAERYTGRVGVICTKSVRPHFERVFGEANVEHFHNLRGTNSLEDVECLLVVGNPAPDLASTINTTAALNQDRIKPFGELNENGYIQPLFYDKYQEYPVTDKIRKEHGNLSPWRKVKGFWSDPDLHAIYDSYREAELIQAIHRARPNVSECDVWIFTSTPTSEPIDGIWDDPPIGPDAIHWKMWLQLEPWLEEQLKAGNSITATSLVEAMGVGREWVSRNNWLEAIADYMPDKWEIALVPTGRRPSKGIIPFIRADHNYNVICST